jgi:hypothetical protein
MQDLAMEVAPAQLTHERLATRTLWGQRDELSGREAAEVQVGAETRRGVTGQVVMGFVVALGSVVQP